MPRANCSNKNIDELLTGPYKEAVGALKASNDVQAAIAKYKDENEEYGFLIDDIFLLRYAIRHTDDIHGAIKAIIWTLEWRHENQALLRPYHIAVDPATGKEVRRDPKELTRDSTAFRKLNQHLPGINELLLYDATSYHGETIYGTPVLYLRLGVSRPSSIEKSTSAKNITNIFLISKEAVFMVCDQITRETRVLVTSMTLVDAKGMGTNSIPSSEFRAMQDASSLDIELYYPHIMGKLYITNVPVVVRVILQGLVKLMPPAVSENTTFVDAPKPEQLAAMREKLKGVPVGAKYPWKIEDTFHGVAYDSLPSFLGGGCRCGKPRVDIDSGLPLFDETAVDKQGLSVGWCIDGVPNNLTERIPNWKKIKDEATEKAAKEAKKAAKKSS